MQSAGYNAGNASIEYAGKIIAWLGTFLTAIALVAAGLVMMILGKFRFDGHFKSDSDDSDCGTPISKIDLDTKKDGASEVTAAEKEAAKIEAINSSVGYESQFKQAEYIAGQSANAYNNSTKKQKIFGWILFAFLFITFALIPCFLFFKVYLGAIISGALFAGTVIIAILVKVLSEHVSRSAHWRKPDKTVEAKGVVKSCVMSSMSSSGGVSPRSSVRVTGVTYKVTVVVDGREYWGYTSRFFESGASINVMIDADGKSPRAHII